MFVSASLVHCEEGRRQSDRATLEYDSMTVHSRTPGKCDTFCLCAPYTGPFKHHQSSTNTIEQGLRLVGPIFSSSRVSLCLLGTMDLRHSEAGTDLVASLLDQQNMRKGFTGASPLRHHTCCQNRRGRRQCRRHALIHQVLPSPARMLMTAANVKST